MTSSVTAVSFFPQLLRNLLVNKVTILIGIDVMHELNNMDFPLSRLLWLLLLSAQHVNMSMAETKAELQYGNIPQEDQLATWW